MIKKIYFIIILFFFLFFFEIYLRTDKPRINQSDKLLGWKLKPNLSYDFNQKNLIGEKYKVNFITNERGSRFYGNLKNSDIKKNRLELLQMFCKTYDNFMDFSKIEGA